MKEKMNIYCGCEIFNPESLNQCQNPLCDTEVCTMCEEIFCSSCLGLIAGGNCNE